MVFCRSQGKSDVSHVFMILGKREKKIYMDEVKNLGELEL